MKIPTKKLSNGFEISSLGLGTWGMGGYFKRERPDSYDSSKDIKTIQKSIELGLKRFDTAELYAGGLSEEILAEGVKDVERKDIFITSKVLGDASNYQQTLDACDRSLERLQTDYLDLYLIHWHDENIPLEETMRAMDELKAAGKIKNIGVSNFSPDTLKRAQSLTNNKIVLNQVHYNLRFREPSYVGLLEYCQNNDVIMEAWRPIFKGHLCDQQIPILEELSEKYDKTPHQIAINWLISQRNVVTIFKTSSISHLKENLGAVGWELDKADAERLTKDFPNQTEVSNAVPLG